MLESFVISRTIPLSWCLHAQYYCTVCLFVVSYLVVIRSSKKLLTSYVYKYSISWFSVSLIFTLFPKPSSARIFGFGFNFWREISELENKHTNQLSQDIFYLKRQLIFLKKPIRPMHQILSQLVKEESDLISEKVNPYFKDILDHIGQISDSIDTYREMASHALDAHLALVSHRMNEVMKTLTIVATIFIPLTFIAGIYGMNFEWMPELKWKWSYPITLLTMGGFSLTSFLFLKRKKWF